MDFIIKRIFENFPKLSESKWNRLGLIDFEGPANFSDHKRYKIAKLVSIIMKEEWKLKRQIFRLDSSYNHVWCSCNVYLLNI